MTRAVLFILVGVAFGLGLGLLLGRKQAAPDSGASREMAAADPAVASGTDAPPPSSLVEQPDDPTIPSPARDSSRALADLIAAMPVPAAERGAGTIDGIVRTESGEPLAGVLVRASRIERGVDEWDSGPAVPKEPALEEIVRTVIRNELMQRANRREARSGEDGSFTLSGLVDAAYWIHAERDGYRLEPCDHRRGGSFRPGDHVQFVAQAVLKVPVTVLLPDGTEPARASIRVESPAGDSDGHRGWSPSRRQIELSAGRHRLKAFHGESQELSSVGEELVLEAGKTISPVTLQLKGRPGIRGKILFAEGEEFRYAQVRAMRVDPSSPIDPRKLCKNGQMAHDGVGGDAFAINDLLPGKYLLGVSCGYGATVAHELIDVAGEMVTKDMTVPPLQKSDYLVLWVYGPNGEALTDVQISTSLESKEGGSSSGTGQSVARSDRSFWVVHRSQCDHQEGRESIHRVTVQPRRFPERTVKYKRSETSEISIQFTEPASLDVTIADFAPETYQGSFHIGIEEEIDEEEVEMPEEITTEFRRHRIRSRYRSRGPRGEDRPDLRDGRAHFGPLEPGSYVVVLSYMSGEHGGIPVQKLPVALRSGMNTAIVHIPRLFSLRVFVDGPANRSSIQIRSIQGEEESWGLSEQVGESGQVVFDGLPAGEYKVNYHGPDGDPGEMIVSVPAQSEVRFQARKHNAMLVHIDDAEGRLAKAGFRTGDLIVGINGAAFESREEWWKLLRDVMGLSEVKFLVARDRDVLEIPLNPRAIAEGGRLEPTSR